MNKIINLVMKTITYFLIVLFLFWIAIRIGIKIDSSIIMLAIGVTIGWAIVQVGERIVRKRKQMK